MSNYLKWLKRYNPFSMTAYETTSATDEEKKNVIFLSKDKNEPKQGDIDKKVKSNQKLKLE